MHSRIKKATAAVVVAVFTATCTLPAASFGAGSIGDLQQEQHQVHNKKDDVKKDLANKGKEKQSLTDQLTSINKEINSVEHSINGLNKDIDSVRDKIGNKKKEIQKKQAEFDDRMEVLNQRMKHMYQYGDVSFLDVLLNSSNLTDFLTRFEYLTYVLHNDQELLDEVNSMKVSLESEKKSLDLMKDGLEEKKQEQQSKSEELASAGKKKEKLVAQISEEEDALYDILADLERESNALSSQIKKLQEEEAKRQEEANKNNGGNANNGGHHNNGGNGQNGGNGGGISNGGNKAPGAYLWPCPSSRVITSNFGYRIHPITGKKRLHSGMDIGAPKGSPVVASANGTVIMSQYYGSYGNCIIVDHGGGMATLYAHMSSLNASKGQRVKAGQTIGRVGSTGASTGNHLHFEVRVNGTPVNPAGYI